MKPDDLDRLMRLFCADEDAGRPVLESTFTRGGWTYASDDRIVARVPESALIGMSYDGPNAGALFDKHFSVRPDGGIRLAVGVPPVPAVETCPQCKGRQVFDACPACLGSGQVTWSYREHERLWTCPECDGEGKDLFGCPRCDGTGNAFVPPGPVRLGAILIAAEYVHKIAQLPDATLFPSDQTTPASFVFGASIGIDGQGLVASLRD